MNKLFIIGTIVGIGLGIAKFVKSKHLNSQSPKTENPA